LTFEVILEKKEYDQSSEDAIFYGSRRNIIFKERSYPPIAILNNPGPNPISSGVF
jgi:hypothetical protein